MPYAVIHRQYGIVDGSLGQGTSEAIALWEKITGQPWSYALATEQYDMRSLNHSAPVESKLCLTYKELEVGPPGSFMFADDNGNIYDKCACGCGNVAGVNISLEPHVPNSHVWNWNGNREKPTLHPSIRRLNKCKWHGHLENGVWKPCGDSGR